jgi:hypothetical protein
MGGFVLEDSDGKPLHPAIPGMHNMDWNDFVFPRMSEKQIRDRSKGDAFAKAIVLAQLTWFLTQCVARLIKQLPLTELELVTAAHAILTVVIYTAWWDKPIDVSCYVAVSHTESTEDKEYDDWEAYSGFDEVLSLLTCSSVLSQKPQVPLFFSGQPHHKELPEAILAIEYAIGAIFGGIHCTAWKFDFSSRIEQLLWRTSSASIASYPVLCALAITLSVQTPGGSKRETISDLAGYLVFGFGTPIYIIARLVLLFLAVFTLRDLPRDAYLAVRWTSFLPHIGS